MPTESNPAPSFFASARATFSLVLITSLLALPAWGGRKFPALPDDVVVPQEYLIKLRPNSSVTTVLNRTSPLLGALASVLRLNANRDVYRLVVPAAIGDVLMDTLAADADVYYLEPNRVRQVGLATPDDAKYATQWALTNIHAYDAWRMVPNRYGTGGDGTGRVMVAVIDTGSDCTHPDFKNLGGSSVYSPTGGQFSLLSQALVPTAVSLPSCAWQDDHGHGTHTSGTIGASTNNGIGVASLGYTVQLLIYKVTDNNGSASDSTIAQAIAKAADAGARVVSISMGGNGYSQTLQDAINYAWSRDTLVVAAAGNANSSSLFFPAGAAHAMGVAATDSTNAKAYYSNWGSSIDIAAPGTSILSTTPTYTVTGTTALSYGGMTGTSMAAPHVSALAGLVATAYPGASAQSIARRIQSSADSTAADGGWGQNLGYGLINAAGAVGLLSRPATTGGVVGQLVDSTGTPISGTVVLSGNVVVVNATGLFRISGLAPGSYTLAASTALGAQSQTVAVSAGADTTTTVVAGVSLGVLTGTLSSPAGTVAGAVVQALQSGLVVQDAVTDSMGSYSLPLPAGTYDLRVNTPGYVQAVFSGFGVSGGSSQVANLSINAMGRFTGVITGPAASPVAGAEVLLEKPGFSVAAVTDATGAYTSIPLPAGTYSVTVSASGMASATNSSVSLANNSLVTQSFNIAPVTVTVTPPSLVLSQLQTRQFTAAVSGIADQRVTWTRTPAVGTISATGLYTAPSSISASAPQTVTVTATSVGAPSRSGTATITAANVFTITLSPVSVAGGLTTTTSKVTLDTAAPAGGATLSLVSSNPAVASVPATVSVAAGATASANFSVVTSYVATTTVVGISVTYGAVTKTANLTVRPPALSYVALAAVSVGGGATTTTNKVVLDGPAGPSGLDVQLSSSDSSVASLPATVTVASGSINSPVFSIVTQPVAVATPITISATYNGVTKTATLTVKPVGLSSVTISPSSVVGGVSATSNRVTLNGPAPAGGLAVAVTSSAPAATVPSPVTVAAGATYATFTITTSPVSANTSVTIGASVNGTTASGTLTVRPPAISSVGLSPTTAAGGITTTGNRIYLDGPAGPSGASVTLSSSNLAVSVPASVLVPAGATNVAFSLTTSGVAVSTTVTISGTYSGVTKTTTLTVRPTALSSISLSPATVGGGATTTSNRVVLDSPAPAAGATVLLTSSVPAAAVVPASITVPAGSTTSAYFPNHHLERLRSPRQ